MSLSVSAIGAVPPIFGQPGGLPPYAQNDVASQSAAATTLAAETGAAAVVYEPGPSDGAESYTYDNPDPANRLPAAAPRPSVESEASVTSAGDEAIVAATSGAIMPPALPETPPSAPVEPAPAEIRASAGPAAPGGMPVPVAAQPQVGQAEAHAQATYAAVAGAMIVGAALADLPKYG
jgi:hypothetical protein